MRAEPDALEELIGYRFAGREVLRRALTHSSHVHEQNLAGSSEPLHDNEQLEFLGDAVLGLLISEELYRRFPEAPEGRLSMMKARLVSAAHLFEVAQRLELGRYLEMGRGEERTGGRGKRTLLVDAVEAIIAALYLDGGLEAARAFVRGFVIREADGSPSGDQDLQHVVDFKSALQQLAQARRLPPPRYSIVRERGPGHSRVFTVEARVGATLAGQADGTNKKSAAQEAARQVYERLLAEDAMAPSASGGDTRDRWDPAAANGPSDPPA